MFFAASSQALAEKLAAAKEVRVHISGFTAVLHTWNQRMEFHPHLRRPNTLESTTFPDLGRIPEQTESAKLPNAASHQPCCSPKISFDALRHRPFL